MGSNEELLEQMRKRLADIENGSSEAEARLERYNDMGDQLKQVQAEHTSADRSVTVIAGPGGSVRDIRLTEGIKRLSPGQLSATIMDTMRQALAAAARQQAAIVQETVGETDVLERVLKTQEQIFGVPMTVEGPASGTEQQPQPSQQPATPPQQQPSPPRQDTTPPRPSRPAPRRDPNDDDEYFFKGLFERGQ